MQDYRKATEIFADDLGRAGFTGLGSVYVTDSEDHVALLGDQTRAVRVIEACCYSYEPAKGKARLAFLCKEPEAFPTSISYQDGVALVLSRVEAFCEKDNLGVCLMYDDMRPYEVRLDHKYKPYPEGSGVDSQKFIRKFIMGNPWLITDACVLFGLDRLVVAGTDGRLSCYTLQPNTPLFRRRSRSMLEFLVESGQFNADNLVPLNHEDITKLFHPRNALILNKEDDGWGNGLESD